MADTDWRPFPPDEAGAAAIGGVAPHESGHKHVTGAAEYVDDMPAPAGCLHACLGLATIARGAVVSLHLDAVREAPGVVGVLTAADIPGANDISPAGIGDDPMFAAAAVAYCGQPLFAVVATTRDAARRAARLAKVAYREEPPIVDIAAARGAGGALVAPPLKLSRGDVAAGLAAAPRRISGSVAIGGQEHFYLEGQVALAVPGEDGEVAIHSATQHPADVQEVTARILGLPAHAVRVHCRRMGGGFGGKETQATLFAAVAGLAARKFRRAVKLRPDRDDDMVITGKRHDFVVDYELGHDAEGRILAVDAVFAARCGHSEDLSRGVTDRALMHADNAYYYPAVRLETRPLRTNTVSNTAFRGYGGPQGIVAAERWIEEIAYALGKDPLDVRRTNFYDGANRSETPYHQPVHDNIIARIVDQLEATSRYRERRAAIVAFNRSSEFVRRGIGLVPIKYGISFSKTSLNQAGCLLQVYRDGSVHLNHGGTEMGQGVHTKVAQVVAAELGLPLSRVRITATATDKVPNASPTAGSVGADLNGMAALDACRQIKARLADSFAAEHRAAPADVVFEGETVRAGGHVAPWADVVGKAYLARVQLSAAGFYKTPGIHWNRQLGKGSPYFYFTYGACCAEVTVDTLTGEYRVERVDVLQDVGRSLNRALDVGQIEGGFIQGMGWVTTEELWWDDRGRLRTHAPSTYKIPVASDRPRIFNVDLAEWSVNAAPTVGRSKATGEPPIMLAIAVLEALGMAAASVADYALPPRLEVPATPERVLTAIDRLRREAAAGRVGSDARVTADLAARG